MNRFSETSHAAVEKPHTILDSLQNKAHSFTTLAIKATKHHNHVIRTDHKEYERSIRKDGGKDGGKDHGPLYASR